MGQQNLPEHTLKRIREVMRRPVGTHTFEYHSDDLFDRSKSSVTILQIPAGQHLFKLERDKNLLLHYYYSSPGTGTRVASIDLKSVPPAAATYIAFSWSPQEIKLWIKPLVPNSELVTANGSISPKQFRVGTDGSVVQIGDQNVKVMGANLFLAGKPIIQPTALDAWSETVQVVEMLAKGQSTEGYIYEATVANLTLVVLVTGFEAYAKKRFIELEQEGIVPNTNDVIAAFYPKREREAGIQIALDEEAKNAKISVLQHIVSRRTINFQNFDNANLAYKKAYAVKFGEIGVSSQNIETLKSFFNYRHKIIHVSPLPGMLNPEKVPPETPVFLNKEKAKEAKGIFQEFIENLHQASLALRP